MIWLDRLATGEVLVDPKDRVRFRRRVAEARSESRALRVRGGNLVVASRDPVETVAGLVGGWKAGVGVVLQNPDYGSREREQFEVRFGSRDGNGVWFRDGIAMGDGEVAIATGGTSGGLRFAVHTVETLEEAAESLLIELGSRSIDALANLPAFHVSGLMPFVRAAAGGGRICRAFPAPIPGSVRMVSMVGTQLIRWLRDGAEGAKGIDLLVVGGGPVEDSVIAEARARVRKVWISYGLTETAGMVAVDPDGHGGRIMPGRSVRIGGGGEIEIGIGGRALRYLGKDGFGTWMPSGDRGAWQGDRLRVFGRFQRVIITGGEKVDPEEVGDVLCRIGGVEEAVVVGLPHREWGERVGAWIVDRSGRGGREILDAVRPYLAGYKLPRRIVIADQIPRNVLGKISMDRIRGELADHGTDYPKS